jgi:Protein of unknown function (DUF1706)
MTDLDPHKALAAGLKADQQEWRDLVAEVGDRLNEPGPMGEWTFRDLAAHIMGWRERTIHRLEAIADGQPDPPGPWPADMDDDDAINDWFQAQAAGRPSAEVLAEIDASHDRLAAALARLPVETLTDAHGIPWLDGAAAVDIDWVSHFHEEHEASVRAWLATHG